MHNWPLMLTDGKPRVVVGKSEDEEKFYTSGFFITVGILVLVIGVIVGGGIMQSHDSSKVLGAKVTPTPTQVPQDHTQTLIEPTENPTPTTEIPTPTIKFASTPSPTPTLSPSSPTNTPTPIPTNTPAPSPTVTPTETPNPTPTP